MQSDAWTTRRYLKSKIAERCTSHVRLYHLDIPEGQQ